MITGPLSLKSYYTVADFTDKKTKFSFKEGATVQVIQKDPGGEFYAIKLCICGVSKPAAVHTCIIVHTCILLHAAGLGMILHR